MHDHGGDQARGLRRMFGRRGPAVFAIVGSAGATAVTLDLAATLAHAGRRVLLLDRSCGEASTGLGLKARWELVHVLRGERTLDELLQSGPHGIAVLPAARALDAIDRGDVAAGEALARILSASRNRFDICLVNGMPPTGDPDTTHDVLLVTAPSRESITDAYARIKALSPVPACLRLHVVVNRARSEDSALSIYKSLAETARRFLAARLDYGGYLPPGDSALAVLAPREPRHAVARGGLSRDQALTRIAQSLLAEAGPHYATS